MYNSWFVYNSKAKAITELNLCIAGSEGTERNRYMTALLEVKNGETLIDTD